MKGPEELTVTNNPTNEQPAHSARDGVGAPQDNPSSDLSDADREWLDQHRALAQSYYGTTPVADQSGVVTQPAFTSGNQANQENITPEVKNELDKSKPYYRIVYADGTESFQNGDLAIPTHGGDNSHAVVNAYLLPADKEN